MFGKKIMRSQSGFSIVEGLIATGLVAMSILAVGYMVNQTSKVSDKARLKQEVPGAVSDALNRARMMLVNTMDTASGLRSQGICTMLEPQRISAGIVPVDLVLSRATLPGNNLYLSTSWVQAYSPDWLLTNFKINSSGTISFDLQPTASNPYIPTTGVDLKSVRATVLISVRSIDPETASRIFGPIPSSITRIDAKKAAYQIETETTYDTIDSAGLRSSNSESGMDLVSVIDIGACDIRNTAGNLFTLSPAGTGIGDPSGRSIYNNTEFKAPGQKPMEIYLLNREVTQGKFIDNRLSADRAHDKVAACTESVFRCKNASNGRQFRSFLNVSADVNYFAQNMFGFQERMQVIPSLSLVNRVTNANVMSGTGAVVEYTNQVRMDPLQDSVNYRRAADGLYYPIDTAGNLIMTSPMSFTAGINRILATVSNVQNMCSNICQPDYKNDIVARLSLRSPNFRTGGGDIYEQNAEAAQPLHCTMCWMKGCTRTGLKTFGSVNNMPDEPLDAQIPECAAAESSEVSKHNPYRSFTITGSGSCLSGRIVSNRLELTARSCTDSLPVMCFAFGQYTFGKNIVDKSVVSSSFANAPDVCRNMGRESILAADLNATFANMGANGSNLSQIPQVGGRYQFLNLSKVGTFTAPQGSDEIAQAIASIRSSFDAAQAGSEFWVALRQDSTGLMADIPQAKILSPPDERHSVYYGASGVILHEVVNETPLTLIRQPTSSSDRAYVLFNHPKFRGTVVASREQENALRFLCMRKSDRTYFTSAAGSRNFEMGGEACRNEGGMFISPHTPRAWLQAIVAAAPHSPFLAFADSTSGRVPVWIAYEQNLAPAWQGEFNDILQNKSGGAVLDYAVDRDGAYVPAEALTREVRYETEVTRIEKDKDGKDVEVKETVVDYRTEPDPSVRFSVACYDADELRIRLRSEATGCLANEDRVLDSNIKRRNVALAWVLSKDRFALDRKEYIRIK